MTHDLRFALRALLKSPGFTLVAVLTLALGIGANTAIFSVVNGVLLQPLEYEDSERLVAIFAVEGAELRNPTSPADFRDWREQSRSFEHMTAARPWSPTLTGRDEPERLSGLMATASLFTLLGAEPALGRIFAPGAGDERVVVLGYPLWQRRFGGDPDAVGMTVMLDGEPHTVIGVMPPGFQFPPFWVTDAELWVPLSFTPDEAAQRDSRFLRVFARLAPGATLSGARTEMDAIARRLRQEYPETNAGTSVSVEPLREPVVSAVRPTLFVLLGVVGFVLMIACVNVANLLLGRAAARERETAIRAALGADRLRLVRQWLTESVLLALLGGGAGLLLAVWGVEALTAVAPDSLPRLAEVGLDGAVLAFTLLVSLTTVALFGVGPAVRASRAGLASPLRARPGGGDVRRGVRHALAGLEIALALVLLVAAGLTIRSFARLQRLDPGFRTESLLTANLSLAASAHAEPGRQAAFFEELVRRVEALPGVRSAGVINHLPIAGDFWRSPFTIDGRAAPDPDALPSASFRVASEGYFRTMGIPLLRGRAFDGRDTRDAAPVVVVNQTLARRFWGDRSPVGERIRLGDDPHDPWATIVGVAADARQENLTDEVIPEVYFPYRQNPVAWWTGATLVVHHADGASGLPTAVREQVWAIDRGVPVSDLLSMEGILSEHLTRQRLVMLLLGTFAATALALAVIGLYGVISYLVAQRTHEIGVRLALGADRTDISRLIVGESMLVILLAAAAGLAAAAAAARLLEALLFGVGTTDPLVFLTATVGVMGVALLASWIPARRAARVEPMTALRAD